MGGGGEGRGEEKRVVFRWGGLTVLRWESQIAPLVFVHESEKPCCWQLVVMIVSMVSLCLE